MNLEQRLAELAVDWPEAPDVAPRVRARLAEEPPRAGVRRRLAIAVAAFLVAVGGVLAVPSARSTVFDWLGIGGVTIERVPEAPTAAPSSSLDLGERIAAPAGLPVPAELGPPDAVYRDGELVTALYGPREGLPEAEQTGVGALLTSVPGEVEEPLIRKLAGPDTTIESVRVNGEPGFWVSGAAHGLLYLHPSGDVHEAPQRLAGPTLVWRRGDRTLRLEADITKSRALAIARSVE